MPSFDVKNTVRFNQHTTFFLNFFILTLKLDDGHEIPLPEVGNEQQAEEHKNDICTSESFYVLLSKIGFTIPGLRLHFRR